VNLGGWLVLEKWLTPSVFAGTGAADEYSLCRALGAAAAERINTHRRSFITEQDFAWLHQHGIDAVRLPVGYWVFGGEAPFVAAIDYVDWAMQTAAQHDITVLLDLHAAPGSQNGWDHSGRSGQIGWGSDETIHQTLDVLERLAERYAAAPNLWGIEVLNEPHWTIPKNTLVSFYEAAYKTIRRHAPNAVAVVVSDSFRPTIWDDVLPRPAYTNVVFDSHLYQVFDAADKALPMAGHIAKVTGDWRALITTMQKHQPIIIGEWSAALDPATSGLNPQTKQQYVAAQQAVFNAAAGNFYWTYKKETPDDWEYRTVVRS
jgi:glucan 1,3-beta-glucosidase